MNTLIVVGSGIKSIAHLTEETKRVIQNADKVLYLVNEENLKDWIAREAKEAESLESIYFGSGKRVDAYQSITTHIINEYQKVKNLCVVFYGHPVVFADSALSAVKTIKAENGNAIILPAVSSMDCLFADLQVDPGSQGCFTIDATELLIYERRIDVYAHVILWQISNLGMHDIKKTQKLNVLCDYLRNYYLEEQPVCIYEAAVLPVQKPRMEWIKLTELDQVEVKPISTLYIPPITQRVVSNKYLDLLEMDTRNFRLSSESHTSSK
jgi:tetrapyrrole methylase family protein/MazG family protein